MGLTAVVDMHRTYTYKVPPRFFLVDASWNEGGIGGGYIYEVAPSNASGGPVHGEPRSSARRTESTAILHSTVCQVFDYTLAAVLGCNRAKATLSCVWAISNNGLAFISLVIMLFVDSVV